MRGYKPPTNSNKQTEAPKTNTARQQQQQQQLRCQPPQQQRASLELLSAVVPLAPPRPTMPQQLSEFLSVQWFNCRQYKHRNKLVKREKPHQLSGVYAQLLPCSRACRPSTAAAGQADAASEEFLGLLSLKKPNLRLTTID